MQDIARNVFAQDSWQTPRNARTLRAYMALKDREIGERIAALRKARGNPPQEIVAQKLGVSNRSYQSWEAGDTKPSWRNLSKLAKYYGVTEEWVLLGDEPVVSAQPAVAESTPDLAAILTRLKAIEAQLRLLTGEAVVSEAEGLQQTEASETPTLRPRRQRPA